ncbi:MAG: methyltransferase family protein [Deltaproteobacteria bacterium]
MAFDEAIHYLLLAIWWGFIIIWMGAALFASRAVKRQSWSGRLVTLALGSIPFFLLFSTRLRLGVLAERLYPDRRVVAPGGLALTLAGMSLTMWARYILGRNWSAMVTIKRDHRLIRTGPYAMIRHPIYSGLLLALLGTAFVVGEVRGFLAVVFAFVAWFVKSRAEERFLREEFGEEYEAYRRHTYAFVPYLL